MNKIIKALFAVLFATCVLSSCVSADDKNSAKGTAEVNSKGVFVDGKPYWLLTGEIHYFRVQPEYWRDRLEKLRACGLNTVSTYCPWNSHEPTEGNFNFEGRFNMGAFLKLCQEMNIKVMLRPGPYICSEWDFGGLPAWLLTVPNMKIRSNNPVYMEKVRAYYKRILKEAEPYFCNNGGPIVAIQIENGYASWGNEMAYLEALREIVLDTGFKGIIYTADGDSDVRINALGPKGVWRTLMCGFDLEKGIDIMEQTQPNMPQMISEWWVGQGLRLGKPRTVRDIQEMSEELDAILARGAHVACYMFHGGTNFNFYNGANYSDFYEPTVTSYDYNALVSEAGDRTETYYKVRDIMIKKFKDKVPPLTAKESEKRRSNYMR